MMWSVQLERVGQWESIFETQVVGDHLLDFSTNKLENFGSSEGNQKALGRGEAAGF